MFNYAAIDKTPTIGQIKTMIDYMTNDPNNKYYFSNMMDMNRYEPNKIRLDLNDAHFGTTYDVVFNDDGVITKFEKTGSWMS